MNTIYNGTYYSGITLPNYKGFLTPVLDFDYNVIRNNNGLFFEITVMYGGTTGTKLFEFLKTRSDYQIIKEGAIKIEELYKLVLESVNYLRIFIGKVENISSPLKVIYDPPLEAVQERLLIELADLNK